MLLEVVHSLAISTGNADLLFGRDNQQLIVLTNLTSICYVPAASNFQVKIETLRVTDS